MASVEIVNLALPNNQENRQENRGNNRKTTHPNFFLLSETSHSGFQVEYVPSTSVGTWGTIAIFNHGSHVSFLAVRHHFIRPTLIWDNRLHRPCVTPSPERNESAMQDNLGKDFERFFEENSLDAQNIGDLHMTTE